MKTFIHYGVVLIGMAVFLLTVQAFAAVTLSDLKISSVSKTMEGDAAQKVTYTFMTNEKPTNVIVDLLWTSTQN